MCLILSPLFREEKNIKILTNENNCPQKAAIVYISLVYLPILILHVVVRFDILKCH